jgi:hypothetical protein
MARTIAGIIALSIFVICAQAAFAGAGRNKNTSANFAVCADGKHVTDISKCKSQKKKH